MRYYIIAGEKSGDVFGGRLVAALHQLDLQAVLRAWGGTQIQQSGAELVVHYRDLAVMGLNFLGSCRKLYNYFKFCQKDIIEFNPDAIILIDYAGFNLRIAKFAKKRHIKTFYYISPKLWAWNIKRMHQIKAYVDHIFSIFPFEENFYKEHNYHAVTYVGNPLTEEVQAYKKDPNFITNHQLDKRPIIALLPGSRPQEITRHLPIMLTLVSQLPAYQFVVAGISELPSTLYFLTNRIAGVKIIYDQTQDILANANLAVVTSGTATLETAYFNVPQVVIYKTDTLTYYLAKWLVKTRYISLVNILARKEVVKEIIQTNLTPESLFNAVNELITDPIIKQQQLNNYETIRNLLGERIASINTAQAIIKTLLS